MGNQENKIDLERMEKLLNGFSLDKVDYQILPHSKCSNPSSEDIYIDREDLCKIMSCKGNMVGYTNSSSSDNISEDVISHIGIDNIRKAKMVLIIYSVNPHVSLINISKFTDDLYGFCSPECNVLFGTETDDAIDRNVVQYKILLTGIDNTDSKSNVSDITYNCQTKC